MKPFTVIAALLFLVVAAAHAYRLYMGWPITIHGQAFPVWGSYIGIALPALLAIMLFSEARR
ncbi:MAG: hypothetical protein ACTHLR_00985 [Rhizomicrobium sp.]